MVHAQVHFELLHCPKTWNVLRWSFFDWQYVWRLLSMTSPVSVSLTPKAWSLRMSRGMGLCKSPSHHAVGSRAVKAHCWGWWRQLKGPANRFHTWPQPTWFARPSTSKLLWKLLKKEKLDDREDSSSRFVAANAAISCAYVVPTRRWAPETTACWAREARKKSTNATHLGAGPQSFVLNSICWCWLCSISLEISASNNL